MNNKSQSKRLEIQQKENKGVISIFNEQAKKHDSTVSNISEKIIEILKKAYPTLSFRYRKSISKKEINNKMQEIDKDLGVTLYVESSSIKPDGGILEVKDDNGKWRIILVSEAKFQGKDIENIRAGKKVGKNNDQDLMIAGNAIERSHKNIREIANYMLTESYFPYLLFLEGSNFLIESISIERPDSSIVNLKYNSGTLNRIDRLTSANYSMPINKNLSKNKFISFEGKTFMLQAASIFINKNAEKWTEKSMIEIMLDVSKTSLQILGSDLFFQLWNRKAPKENEK